MDTNRRNVRGLAPDPAPPDLLPYGLRTQLRRATGRRVAGETAYAAAPHWARPLLRVPLAGKLAGANGLIALAASAVIVANQGGFGVLGARELLLIGSVLGGSLLVNTGLVVLALSPLQQLEDTAERIWRGDLEARVELSVLADREMSRVGNTINVLLDGLMADRARTRELAMEVIRAGDRERASVARELHDSVAQVLAALVMQLGAAGRDCAEPALADRIGEIKEIGTEALEEVRMLAHTMYPRVLDDLGLVAALKHLAKRAGEHGHVRIVVDEADGAGAEGLSPAAAAALYRVAQEAVSNALRHGDACVVRIGVTVRDGAATLVVQDDGRGFDVREADRQWPGMGLFTMRERVALVDGRFSVESGADVGTRVVAHVPVDRPAAARA